MPKADATGLAPKKSADYNPPAHHSFVREGRGFHFYSSLLLLSRYNTSLSQCAKAKSNPFLW
jgi:hypothetical protein